MSQLEGMTIGQYRLIEQIGRGGMASVYRAYQASLDRLVAIKVLPSNMVKEPGFLERFRREATSIARLRHPNILTVYDFGEAEELTYIVMEYVHGGTLKERLGSPLPLDWSAEIIRQVADALDYAHSQNIVHRDVKPANVLMARDNWALLSDFGIAKIMEPSAAGLTGVGVGIGTPEYMSPEQGEGINVDGRSDIYSLGIMLFQMATGVLPYTADTPLAVVMKHLKGPLPMPRSINPAIPESVERVILKATAKNPDDRYQTAGEMAKALQAIVQEEAVATAPSTLTQTDPSQRTGTFADAGQVGRGPVAPETSANRGGSKLPYILGGVAVVFLCMVVGVSAAAFIFLSGVLGGGKPASTPELALDFPTVPPSLAASATAPVAATRTTGPASATTASNATVAVVFSAVAASPTAAKTATAATINTPTVARTPTPAAANTPAAAKTPTSAAVTSFDLFITNSVLDKKYKEALAVAKDIAPDAALASMTIQIYPFGSDSHANTYWDFYSAEDEVIYYLWGYDQDPIEEDDWDYTDPLPTFKVLPWQKNPDWAGLVNEGARRMGKDFTAHPDSVIHVAVDADSTYDWRASFEDGDTGTENTYYLKGTQVSNRIP